MFFSDIIVGDLFIQTQDGNGQLHDHRYEITLNHVILAGGVVVCMSVLIKNIVMKVMY